MCVCLLCVSCCRTRDLGLLLQRLDVLPVKRGMAGGAFTAAELRDALRKAKVGVTHQ